MSLLPNGACSSFIGTEGGAELDATPSLAVAPAGTTGTAPTSVFDKLDPLRSRRDPGNTTAA